MLTPAEWRVLDELRTGATNAEIAVRLGLGITTVKFHIRNMRGKLELDDRSDLAAWRREAEPRTATRRRLLAPLGLLAGFWKPVVGGTALVVVGGSAIAAGVLAYAIANDGEAASEPDEQVATAPGTDPTEDQAAVGASPTPPKASPTPGGTGDSGDTGGDSPEVVFWGDISSGQQAAVRERTADIVAFFDQRFGVRVPGLVVHVGEDRPALAQATLETEGQSSFVGLAQYRDKRLFVDMTVSGRAIERLYFHALQDHLAGDKEWGPWWLGEGTAMYTAYLFREWRGEGALAVALAHDRQAASFNPTPLHDYAPDSATAPELFDSSNQSVAALAVEWLVQQAGEDSLVGYYQALPGSPSWEDAFERTFGIPFGQVYRRFAAYRAEVVEERRALRGIVLGPDGDRLWNSQISIYAHLVDSRTSTGAVVNYSGRFTVLPPDGTYRLAVVCLPSWATLGWYEADSGFTTNETAATPVVVDGEAVNGIVIRLPALPNELLSSCSPSRGS